MVWTFLWFWTYRSVADLFVKRYALSENLLKKGLISQKKFDRVEESTNAYFLGLSRLLLKVTWGKEREQVMKMISESVPEEEQRKIFS